MAAIGNASHEKEETGTMQPLATPRRVSLDALLQAISTFAYAVHIRQKKSNVPP